MAPRSSPHRRPTWLVPAAVAALLALPMSCTETPPPAAPDRGLSRFSIDAGGQWVPGDRRFLQPSLSVAGDVTAAAAPAAFTAAPFAADFVVTGSESGGEHYFPSNGDGTFGARSDIPGLGTVDGLDVADLDGDGDNDFLVCDGTTGETYLYRNDGAGAFTTSVVATGVTPGGFCTNLRIADFNGDGRSDFVVGDLASGGNRVFVYLQTTSGAFAKVTPGLDVAWNAVGSVFGIAAGDVDGDGNQDVLLLSYTGAASGEVRLYEGNGTGAMAAPTLLFNVHADFNTGSPTGLALFDSDTDGDLDIVAGGSGGGEHYVYANNGSGVFTKPTGVAFDVNNFTGVDAFDADGDGDHDLVAAAWSGLKLYLVTNQGGTLAAPQEIGDLAGASIGVGAPSVATGTVTKVIPPGEAATVTLVENGEVVGGVEVPANGLGDGDPNTDDNVRVTVRRISLEEAGGSSGSLTRCHDYLLGQTGPCIEVTATVVETGQPATVQSDNIIVGVCLETPTAGELYKFDDPGGPVQPLKQAQFPCEPPTGQQSSARNWLEGLAMGITKRVGSWLSPKPLYAAHVGFGGVLPVGGKLSFYTWAAPMQVGRAGLALNAFNSNRDLFAIDGVFPMGATGLGDFSDEQGFNPAAATALPVDPVAVAANTVTVTFGKAFETRISTTIPPSAFRYSSSLKRWVYIAPFGTRTGVLTLAIDPVTGALTATGAVGPSEGGGNPTFRGATVLIGHRLKGAGLLCGTAPLANCTLQQ
jgi:hypothetical protein